MKSLAGRGTALMTAAMVAAATVLPQTAIPEPLGVLREFSVAIATLAVLLAWVLREWLRAHVRRVLTATIALLVALIVVHLQFVKPVDYRTVENDVPRTDRVWFITGWAVADPSLEESTSEDLIRWAGGGWDELRAIWGHSFDVMALTYSGLYLLAIGGLVLSTAGAASAKADAAPAGTRPPRGPAGKKRRARSRR